jgi:hypothetical protein
MTQEDMVLETMEWLNDIYGAIEVRGKIFKAGDLLRFFEESEFLDAMGEYVECKKSGVI